MSNEKRSLIQVWKDERDSISTLFQEKKYKEAIKPMQECTKNFLRIILELNHLKSSMHLDQEALEQVKHKPINLSERLDYVDQNPSQYHAFIQLDALYTEVEKLAAKVEILEQTKKS
ncbi:hypothetical protein J2T56_000337 [Natronobacillus azotifigens]|uniref:YpoC-like domain-containing protein n=1 Tax=Natronobacillus azotifigens TaxID=472978 RepID=A0A9J6R8B6_9BACI|nr:hypothetical protein [Natronobacillus azotifigens]MCZ0701888.1 hypothetical protein [Natronobacillus azotifigens]